MNHRQYGLTYTVHLEKIDQFLSKGHTANSDRDKIQTETHVFPSKVLFCYLKYFWRISNQGQYGLLHNFGQSLSKTHIVRFMLNITMFLANSDQEAIWNIDPYCPYKIFIKLRQKLILFSISNAFKKLNFRKPNLIHIVLNIMIFSIGVAFSNLSSNFWSKDNTVWPLLSLF